MTDFNPAVLRTVHLVPLTAYDASGNLNREVQAAHTSRMVAAGMRVFLPGAGTSEFHSLTADEIVELTRITREAAGPDVQIFTACGYQVGSAAEIAVRAVEAGADGVMFMPFPHPYLSDAGARDYYLQVLEQAGCPALVYKKGPIPSDDLLLELAAHPQVVGVKYSVNAMHQFRKVVLADTEGIEWLCGSAERFAPYYMLAGSGGFTTGAGNFCPHLSLAMHAAFAAGEFEEGMRLQQLILPIEDYRARAGDSYNISMLKHAMTVLGEEFGPPRPPQRQLTPAERDEIEQLLQPVLAAEQEMQSELTGVGLSKG